MVIRTINGLVANSDGNLQLLYPQIYGETDLPITWIGTTVVSGGSGSWSIDYSEVGFSRIKGIFLTLESGTITNQADLPLGGHVTDKTLTSANGKAYKVSSAGLLAAMQQISADNGTIVNVMVIGYK